jgi:hypothetical protein
MRTILARKENPTNLTTDEHGSDKIARNAEIAKDRRK